MSYYLEVCLKHTPNHKISLISSALACILASLPFVSAYANNQDKQDLFDLSLEELLYFVSLGHAINL